MLRVILRRALPCVFVLLALSAPVFAQAPAQTELDPRALLPADIDAWLSLDIRDSGIINALNVAARSAALLQPGRAGLQPLQGLEQALPLQQLNTEALPIFARDFAPWVEEQVLLAWSAPGPAAQSPLLILPTRDVLQAAASFSSILEEQDLLRRELHQGQTLWLADRSSIAFAPGAVLIGPEALVRAALDVQAAAAPRLLDAAAGMTERDAAPAGQILSGWLRGEKTLRALAALLSGSEESAPLLSAFGQTLAAFDSQSLLQQLVLEGEAQALTFSLATDALRLNVLRLTLQLHHDDAAASEIAHGLQRGRAGGGAAQRHARRQRHGSAQPRLQPAGGHATLQLRRTAAGRLQRARIRRRRQRPAGAAGRRHDPADHQQLAGGAVGPGGFRPRA